MASPEDVIAGNEFPYQDYIILGGAKSPGRATIVGAGSPRDWDKRKGYGFSGAFVIYTGDNLAKFKVQIDLWTPDQFAEWAKFAKLCLVKPPTGTKPKAMDIQHPLLSMDPIKITSVVVEDCSQFTEDDDGLWSCTIDFLQYRAPMPALGKPLASIPSVKKPKPTAKDAAEVEIEKLTEQFKALANGP